MKSRKHLELARRLTLRRGVPNAPSAKEVPTEVRSNSFVAIDPPAKVDTRYAVGNVVIEWSFRVPPAQFRRFTSFLADNEAMIAASCERLMRGVHYRGTFLTTEHGRSRLSSDHDLDEGGPIGPGQRLVERAVEAGRRVDPLGRDAEAAGDGGDVHRRIVEIHADRRVIAVKQFQADLAGSGSRHCWR